MNRILRDILSGVDNNSIDSGRVIWVVGAATFILSSVGFQGAAIYRGQSFDPFQFCTGFGAGFGAVLAAGGWGVAKKDKALAEVQQQVAA